MPVVNNSFVCTLPLPKQYLLSLLYLIEQREKVEKHKIVCVSTSQGQCQWR